MFDVSLSDIRGAALGCDIVNGGLIGGLQQEARPVVHFLFGEAVEGDIGRDDKTRRRS